MDYDSLPAPEMGHALRAVTVNLLVRDVADQVDFLSACFGMTAHQARADYALMLHAGQPVQLHADHSYAAHPLHALLPETPPRGAGIELRLHEADPDQAVRAAADFPRATVLQPATDKPNHGLREAVILCPNGYAWVPSRRI